MPIPLTVVNKTFDYPLTDDENWGPAASDWAIAVTDGMLQKTGGTFSLLSDANFGPTNGLISPYFKSTSANISSNGILRLSQTDVISWSNLNISLGIDSSNNLIFSGNKYILPSDINGGLNASSATFLRGDGTWATPAGSGSVILGTAGQIAYYVTTTNQVAGNTNITVTSGGILTAVGLVGPLTGNVTGNVTGNLTGNITGNAATVTTNANLTGPITSVGNATSIASQTGTGTTFVMSVSPVITGTPSIAAATATTPATSDNSTNVATTAMVQALVAQAVAQAVTQAVPVGMLMDYAAWVVPAGYLLCDGTAYSRTTFANLFAVIGTTYGAGDGSTTFNVPNFVGNGAFTRCFGGNSGAFGQVQAGQVQSHTHSASVADPGHYHTIEAYIPYSGSNTAPAINWSQTYLNASIKRTFNIDSSTTGITVTNASTGGNETRPINIAVTKIIKY
jgi:microcystin-dependent protein